MIRIIPENGDESVGARAELERELGGPLAALELLTEAETADLLGIFRQAQRTENAAMVEAVDKTVGALPWPLRTAAKKIMFGNKLG
ncbi:hypothetical protein NS506_04720 [Nocardia seriolae]|uniref:Uncharacterized protein n=1 Tax=Nocardia seriolae TaxID=37332 RepID=A0ABC9YST4_9NOCA|nr:hypothetical protein NS506_04720 [Nocardia seriolae]OJF80735.1 hypothetical protein NS14008_17860 [Nocardia seriolae]PSK31082.1 hypothetical protein C6575_12505 [Nocardia seriolae]RLP31670.1 hypothetical protein D6158_11730 [Nocardia seriolae]BEK96030.1 hypothetical protein NSER024013_39360 [Nocardia seriolae]